MKFKVRYTLHFARQFKKLSRQYRDTSDEFNDFLENIELLQKYSIGNHCYKIRYSPKVSEKGKRGSLRVIVLLLHSNNVLVPVTIYEKSKKEVLTKKEMLFHLKSINEEL